MADFKSVNGYLVKDEFARTQAGNNAAEIQVLNEEVGNLKDTTSSHTNTISTIQQNMSTINENIADVNESLTTTNSYMNSVQASVNAMQEDYSGVTSDVATLKEDNTTNKNKINTLETDNSTNKVDITNLKAADENTSIRIGDVEEDVEILKGEVLFEGDTKSNITLEKSLGDYKKVVIEYRCQQYVPLYSSVEITDPSGKNFCLWGVQPDDAAFGMYAVYGNMNQKSITISNFGCAWTAGAAYDHTNYISITKVTGYK